MVNYGNEIYALIGNSVVPNEVMTVGSSTVENMKFVIETSE